MTKKLVKIRLEDIKDIFEGNIDEIVERLIKVKNSYESQGFTNLQAIVEHSYDYYDIDLYGERLETDAEYQKRLKIEARERDAKAYAKRKKEEKERREYERLKKKFETNNLR